MTEWRETELGAVCELKRGYDLPASRRNPGQVPIVSSSGITGYHSEAKVKAPGVVTGRYGTLGKVFFIETDFWPLNTALYVRDFKANEPRFVAALLQALELGRHDGAAAVPGVNRNQLHSLPVLCPDLDTQRCIGIILGTLDELIENNRRRIDLLEKMTQAIYREWFVHFQYPGHEDVPLADSPLGQMPETWEVNRAADLITAGILDVGDGYRAKNSEMSETSFGLPFVRVADVHNGCLRLSTCDHLPLEYQDRLKTKISRGGDTLISMKGTVGRCAYVDDRYPPFVYSPQISYWRSLDFSALPPSYLYFWIRSDQFSLQCAAVKGATDMADYVNLRDQRKMMFVRPTPSVVLHFNESAGESLRTIGTLRIQMDRLFAIRDLLLPKLVTGQIDVTSLDLGAMVETVA